MAENCGEQLLQSTLSTVFGGSLFPSNLVARSRVNTLPATASGPTFVDDYENFAEPRQEQQPVYQTIAPIAPQIREATAQNSSWQDNFLQPPQHPLSMGYMPYRGPLVPQHPQSWLHDYTQQMASRIDPVADSQWIDLLSHSSRNVTDMTNENVQDFHIEEKASLSYEEKRAESKFYKFLHDYKTGTLAADSEETVSTDFRQEENSFQVEGEQEADWAQEHQNPLQRDFDSNDTSWTEEYAKAFDQTEAGDSWADEFLTGEDHGTSSATAYPFKENNPYLLHSDPFAEGQALLRSGAVAAAALAFEAECQRETPHPEAWLALGTTQQENEKDALAILALQTATVRDPSDLQPYIALATSQTNEYMYAEAMHSLASWLNRHPMCQHGEVIDMNSIEATLLRVLSSSPGDVDAYIALGTFYNVNHNYVKGVEAFENALQINPNSSALWNKLGATQANSGDSARAMEAYRKALSISPGSHRCLYNLAVALMNNGQNAEAAVELTKVLKGQEGDERDFIQDSRRKSHDIWNLLRMNVEMLGRDDLLEVLENEDVDGVRRGLGIV